MNKIKKSYVKIAHIMEGNVKCKLRYLEEYKLQRI